MATKLLKYCAMILRALFDLIKRALFKRSPTQEGPEEDTDSPGTERQDVQPGPSSDPPVNPGVVGFPSSSWSSDEGSVNNKFDVFISHRGPDTKSTLAYHLYDLLRDRGVEAFLDKEELPSGERFPDGIEEAIASSKVDVCILSRGFAESVWCLKELVMMLQKFERGLSTLIPIFYDVEPAEVRHLKGAFGQGFVNLQSKGRNSSEDIEQWRRALRRIADISGYQGKGELCRDIVTRISEVLDTGYKQTPQNVITRENELCRMIHDIMKCRNNGHGVTSVEISGIGGIGKTTFAEELYNQIYTKYDRYCFIQDVNGLVEKHGVDEVHRQIFSKLFRDHQRYLTEGKKLLKKRLHNAEILVVIDNIHSKIPLSIVFIEDDVSLNPRSTIIVTSREEGVLKYDAEVKGYCQHLISLKMKKLDFDTSKKIFCHHAFGGISNVKNEFNEMIEKIVKKCDGVPLALTLLGKHVYQQDIMFWKNLWSSMKDCLHGDVKKILKFSYDNLGSDLEKCLFLDIATFFHWEKKDVLLEIRRQSDDECGESEFQYALHMLKRNLLINVSKDGILQMHDVLVDLGRSIVKDENLCPGRRSRVWSPSDVRHMLSQEQGTKKVKALTLVSKGKPVLEEGRYPWSADVFSELSSLEILILHGHCIKGDFSKLSKRLLWLRWTDFPYQEIPLKLSIKHLRVLHVTGKNLIRVWAHPPQEVPSRLRQLIIPRCIKLERLPETIGRLRHLSSINLDRCASLKLIPESFGQLHGLKDFQLRGCDALEQLPETLGGLTSLRSLKMSNCFAVVSLPESIGKLQQLSSIYLDECTSLKIIPRSFGQLKALKYLYVYNCKSLKQLPESFGDLRNLISLDMRHCDAMVSLPESFGKLLQLQELKINCCNGLERLPQSFQCLASLCAVTVYGCRKLRISPEHVQGLQPASGAAWNLSTDYDNDREVADSWFDGIGNAEHPNFDFWKNYSRWHSQVPQPHNLRWLLREVVQDIHMKKNKRYLDSIASQESLRFIAIHFFEAAGNMTFPCKVRGLSLQGFWNLRELPHFVGNNRYIRSLNLSCCFRLQMLPESLGSLSCLESLSLRWCCNLQELPDTIGNLPALTSLTVNNCLALTGLPSSLQNLYCLRSLDVEYCWMVEAIHLQGLLNLTHLTVRGCGNLKSIVGISNLRNLGNLEIEGCMNLKSIVELSNICKLTVGGFAAFRFLPDFFAGGRYQLRFFEDHVEHLPTNLKFCWYQPAGAADEDGDEVINAKTSPLFLAAVKERIRHVLDSSPDKPSFFIHELAQHAHVPSLPFRAHAMAVCCVSSVYADDFPDHIPLPMTDILVPRCITPFRRFDFGGEEIHVDVGGCTDDFNIERGDFDLNVHAEKDIATANFQDRVRYPNYEASVKEGCIIFLDGGGREQSRTWASEIRNIFVSELGKQRLMSRAWTELPSQLQIHDFSALDIAGCQITKISRHCNTCIMEEETGLTWKRRGCVFMDDHSLLLQQPKNSKHSFLAYPGVDRDLEAAVANLYEMSISILAKGKKVHSRKLQQIRPKTEEEIPSPLNTLLQSRGFHSTSETVHRLRLFVLKDKSSKGGSIGFHREGLENESSNDDVEFEDLENESNDDNVGFEDLENESNDDNVGFEALENESNDDNVGFEDLENESNDDVGFECPENESNDEDVRFYIK